MPLRILGQIPNKREFLARSCAATGIIRMLEQLAAHRPALVVLTYHRIAEPGIEHNDFYDPVISATPEAFRAQILSLRDRFRIVQLEDIANSPVRTSPEKPSLLLTFDDGYRDNFDAALPILRELSVPAIFFIPTGLIQVPRLSWWDHIAYVVKRTEVARLGLLRNPEDAAPLVIELGPRSHCEAHTAAIMAIIRAFLNKEIPDQTWFLSQLDLQAKVAVDEESLGRRLFMTWNHVEELAGSGMSIGSHGHNHVALGSLDDNAQRGELQGSKKILERVLGREVTTVAYPYGWPGTFTKRTTELAAEAGYRLAFTSLEGINHPDRDDFAPHAIRRLNVGTGDTASLLRARTALHRTLGHSFL